MLEASSRKPEKPQRRTVSVTLCALAVLLLYKQTPPHVKRRYADCSGSFSSSDTMASDAALLEPSGTLTA
jgi:hypothetical protein